MSIEKLSGKTIKEIKVLDSTVQITFDYGTILTITDEQDCCETRYFRTDDDLEYFKGAKFLRIEETEGPTTGSETDDVHETMFLNILTSMGVLSICCHNKNSGYYTGFYIRHQITEGAN